MSGTETRSVDFLVTGMSCGHCESAVREEVSGVAGVEQVDVSLETGRLAVTGRAVDEAAVIAAVDEAGYTAERSGQS